MRFGRRSFLGGSLAGVGATLIGSNGRGDDKPRFFDPYEKVPLGKSGLKVTRVGIGTGVRGWNRQSNQTRMGKEKFTSLLKGAYDRGIRLFDMADLYGTHPYLLPALEGIPRDSYTVVSKLWFHKNGIPDPDRPDADVVVERFLKELKTDYIDLLLIHCMTHAQWPEQMAKQLELMATLKQKGLIRAHGISCHALPALQTAVDEPWVDSVHTRINPFGVKMDGPAEKVAPVLQQLHKAGKGIVGMKIIGEGAFRDDEEKRNQSVAYALTGGFVDTMIIGFEHLWEMDDFEKRVRRVPVPSS